MQINILCWNCRGIMSSAYPLSTLLDNHDIDIALISEHKLLPRSIALFDSINPKYSSFVNVDSNVDQYGSLKCGRSGTAVMYKKIIQGSVGQLDGIDNDRIIGIELSCSNQVPLYIFCVYFPACNDITLYKATLNDIESLIAYYSQVGNVIAAGDFNGQYKYDDSPHNTKSTLLTKLIDDNNLCSAQYLFKRYDDYTFVPTKTSLDHVIVDCNISRYIRSFKVADYRDILTSDHLPITVTLDITGEYSQITAPRFTTAWHKCTGEHINRYQKTLENELNCIINTDSNDCDPEFLNSVIVKALHAAEREIPRSKFNEHAKPYWCPEIKAAHARARQMRRVWKSLNKPRDVQSQAYKQYKEAKAMFMRTREQYA